jgi:glutathione synthase
MPTIPMQPILIICDPLDGFKIATDTTYLIIETALKLGYPTHYCLPQQVYADDAQIQAQVRQIIQLKKGEGVDQKWYADGQPEVMDLKDFAVVLVRNDPPFNLEYYYLTTLLSLAEKNGARVVNNGASLRNFNEKLAILNFPEFITPTVVTKDKEVINDFLNRHDNCVIKPLDLMAGRSVFKLTTTDINRNVIIETITNYYTQTIMLQRFIPEVVLGDKRIFIVDGEVIKSCLYRIPQNNQIRGNLAAGGRGEAHPISAEDYVLATTVAKWLKQHDIVFAGLDVIGNKLTEINITSPTGARQILEQSGINVAELLLKAAVSRTPKPTPKKEPK